jgi:hypothetical protein
VKRLKFGSLEVSADVEPQSEGTAAETNTTTEESRRAQSRPTGWWWDGQKHPVLVETLVCLLAVGLLAYAAVDPHGYFNSVHRPVGLLAAVLLVAVIGRRAVRRVSRR